MNLFIYGTLLASEIFEALTERIPVYLNASLKQYKRVSLYNYTFPGLVPERAYIQQGCLVEQISNKEMKIIENYEGEMYVKRAAQVCINQKLIPAYTFVLKTSLMYLVRPLDWD